MAKQASNLFLEEWLRSSTSNSSGDNNSSGRSADASAQTIIQAWAELRDCLQKGTFDTRHLQSLKSLVNSKASLYVADPQAKLLISILSSPNIFLPRDSYPLFLRLLYVWVRKSPKPSLALMDLAVEVIGNLFTNKFDVKSTSLFAEGVLLVGAFCFVPFVAENTKTVCLKLVCRMLEEQYQLIGSVGELIPDVLAGIGFISTNASEKIRIFSIAVMENPKTNYAVFAVLMATAGSLKASNRPVKHGERLNVVFRLKVSAEAQIEVIASNLLSNIGACSNFNIEDAESRFLLHCLSLAASRSGGLNSTRGPLLLSLALALLVEVFQQQQSFNPKIIWGRLDMNQYEESQKSSA